MKNVNKKNYEYFVRQAEKAFQEERFLEAFLLQSCIIEGVLKNYAFLKLTSTVNRSEVLKRKFYNFEFTRLLDELFLLGSINKDLYENLSKYRKERNKVVHKLLNYSDKKLLKKDLREAYKIGKPLKTFIVDEMVRSRFGKTMAELSAEEEFFLAKFLSELHGAFKREIIPEFKKFDKGF